MTRIRLLALLVIPVALAAQSLTPYHLEAEARHDPVGLDVPHPRLAWKLKSPEGGARQTAYQILVASTAQNLAQGRADLWDSARVASEETAWIPYAGRPLSSFARCWWKVRVWDSRGVVSQWSDAAEWTMGATDAKDWRGSWIAWPESRLTSGPLPIFRKDVAVDRPLRRALALVSGLGFHELRVNGVKAGDAVLAPAWSNYRDTVYYETLDVTALLAPGRNTLGVLLGNGFYNVAGGRYSKFTGSFGQPRLFLQLHLEYDNGATADVATDRSWRVAQGPLALSSIYGGEDFDARLEPEGWDRPGFDDSTWKAPAGVEAPGGVLRAQSSPPVGVQQTFAAAPPHEVKPGVQVYDLGQNFAGWPKIEVSGERGAEVRLTPGELLDSAGLVSQRSSGGPVWFSYTLKGAGRETWAPRFAYYGFRYVQVEITGRAVLHQMQGQFVHLDAPRTGRFHCSNELFNRIHALIDAAVRSNLQHSLTDCPHREKLGWLEESYLMGPSLLYDWDLRAWLPKAIRDTREAQTTSGLVPDIAPEFVTFAGGFRDSPEWGSAAVMLPWLAWTWYGDRQPLEDSYATMERYADYLESKSQGRLLSYGLGDWYDIGPGRPGQSKLTPAGLTATATWLEDLRVLGGAARLLGRNADAGRFGELAEQVRAAFWKAFERAGSQTAWAMPLALGLAPESARAALLEKLVADIRRLGNHTSAGDIGYHYVVRALLDAGRSDVLFDMASRTDAPSYGAQLAAGATSLTEAWDADPGSSQNHLMLGHIEEWFYAGLAGIRPDTETAGLRRIEIRPQVVGDVKSVEASWETFRGPVKVAWRVEGGAFQMAVDIPPGITANVVVPGGGAKQVGSGHWEFDGKGLRQ